MKHLALASLTGAAVCLALVSIAPSLAFVSVGFLILYRRFA